MAMSKVLLVAALVGLLAPICSAITDADILQFALNLEYLEANFYSCAAFGYPIAANLTGGGPTPLGCEKAKLSAYAQQYANNIARDEIAHVTFLRAALTAAGATPVPQPLINIGTAFAAAANAALGATLSPPFSPYGDDILFYHGAYIFEDVGVTAYNGAAPLISNSDYLSAAAGILAAEAYHAGAVRSLLQEHINEYVYPYGAPVGIIVNAISALRDAAAGTKIDRGLMYPMGGLRLVPADANAIVFTRTPAQVLKVVYLGGTTKGGFFPNGLNGAITSAA